MPPVVAAVAAYFVVSTAMATFMVAMAVVTLASVAYSAYMMASMKKPGASSDATTRLQTVRSSVQPHRVVYGECMTGGVLVYAQSHGDNNKFISLVVAFTAHEVDAIKEVWLNEKLSSDIAFVKHIAAVPAEGYWAEQEPVYVDGGGDSGYYAVAQEPVWVETKAAVPAHDESWAQVTKYLGTQSQAADPLLVSLDPKPTALITKSPSSGLNDLTTSGDYSAVGMAVFTISMSAVGTTDSFTWSDDLGHSGTLAMTGASQLLVNGISVKFAAKTGHSLGQIWELRAFDGAPWTAECTLTGCSYVVVTLEKSDTAFPNGLPNIKALIRGNNQIYDPATGTSGYSDNWALCVRDYLTKPYGLGAPAEDINEATAIAARNICDEMVTTTTGPQKRYTLNGSFTVDKTPVSIMNEILATAYGAITWTQGQYRIFPAAYYAPDMTFHGMNAAIPGLTESDLRAGIKVRPMPSMKDRFNTVKGTYISPETWQEVDFPPVTNALYVAEDGGEIVKDIQLSYVTDPARAQRIAKLMLEKSRQGIVVDFPAKWSAFPLAVGDTVPISVSRLGWDQKIFSVRDWKMNPDGGVDLSLQEDAAACYSWNSGEETTVDLAQNTILPDPRYSPVPTGITVGEELYATTIGSIVKARAVVTWDNMSMRQYEVNYLAPNNTIWGPLPLTMDTTCLIDDVIPGAYQVRVRSMNHFGVWGEWGIVNRIIYGKSLPPADISGFSATLTRGQMLLTWLPTGDLDISGYEIQIGTVWDDAGNVKLIQDYSGTSYSWAPIITGEINMMIKAIDTSGNYSLSAATAVCFIVPPAAVTNFTAELIRGQITFSWSAADDAAGYEIQRGDVWDGAGNTVLTTGYAGTSYMWTPPGAGTNKFMIKAISVFGDLSIDDTAVFVAAPLPTAVVFSDISEELYATNTANNIKSKLITSWSGGGANVIGYDVEVLNPSSASWTPQGRLTLPTHIVYDADLGFWQIRVRAVNDYGMGGAWAVAAITINGKSALPASVTGFGGTLTRGQVVLKWNAGAELDIAGYEIQLGSAWNGSGYVILTTGFAGTSYSWTPTQFGDSKFMIKAIDTSGNYSANEVAVTVSVPLPTQVAFSAITEALYATNTPGDIKSKAVVSWSGGGANVAGYDVEIWGPADSAWSPQGNVTTPTYTIYDITPGVWKIQVRAVNDYSVAGPWTETQTTLLGKTAPPANVTDFSGTLTRGQVVLKWNAGTELDIAGYEIQLGSAWNGAGHVILTTGFAGTSYSWTPTQFGDSKFMIKAIDTSGNYSINEVAVTVSVPLPTQVSFSTITEALYATNTPGDIKSKLITSWSGGGANVVGYDVEVLNPSSASWTPQGRLTLPTHIIYDADLGVWQIRVRAVNDYGMGGEWAVESITISGKSALPSSVTGFSGTLTRGQVVLKWNASAELDIAGYEIQLGNAWNGSGYVILTTGFAGTSYSWTPTQFGDSKFMIKAIDTSGNYSANEVAVTVSVPLPTQVAFSAITEALYATNTPGDIKSKALVSWSGGGANVAGYDVEIWGPADSAWSPQGNVTTPTYTIYDITPGVWKVQVRALNDYSVAGPWTETQTTLLGKTAPPASVTGLQAEIVSGQMRIFWNANPELDVSSYEIQIGTTWDGPGNLHLIQQYSGTSYMWTPNSSGTITILAKAIDTTGNFSVNATSATFAVVAPAAVSSLTQNVIDNIVELRWSPANMGSFPVSYYELSKGNDFATSSLIGRIYSTFNILAETAAGSYKYWVVAVDAVGLRSAETGVYTVVSQPPDYILVDNQNLVLSSCTLSNAVLENDALVLPVNTSITFENHFISNPDTTLEPWSTPQDQINDGYPVYAQPGPITSSIMKIVDYGTLLPPANITMSVTRSTIAGNPVVIPEMFISADGVTYTSLGSGMYSVMAPAAFRYVKYVLSVGSAANDGAIITVTGINVKLDVKQRSSTTTVNVTDTVGDGTQVLFSSMQIAPVDVLGITANAPYYGNANDPVTALINFVDAPYPTSFKVLAWNKAGTRISAAGVVITVKYI